MQLANAPGSEGIPDMKMIQYELECSCRDASLVITSEECKGDNIYFCNKCEKMKKYQGIKYCDSCGPNCHGPKKKRNHAFDVKSRDVVLLKHIIETGEDDEKSSFGQRILRTMIGTERYNNIAGFINKYNTPIMCSLTTGSVLSIEIAAELSVNVAKHFVISNVSAVSGIAAGAVCFCEIGYYGYRWYRGEIEMREFFRLTGRSIVKNGAIFGGAYLGVQIGATLGIAAGPVGIAVGVVAGFILGVALGIALPLLYDKIFPDHEGDERKRKQEVRKIMIKEAMKYFHYQPKDIENEKFFNKKELRKRFKSFALQAHPDRRDGDHSEWAILSQHYGILTALCEQRLGNKKMVQSKVQEITI